MNIMITYGISGLFICFVVLTFLLSRIQTGIFPENYDYKLDPFWPIFALMFIGGSVMYFVFPHLQDMISEYKYTNIIIPFIFAVLIYGCYLLGSNLLANLLTLGGALTLSFMQPDDFMLFPEKLTLWQDRLVVALFLFIISKGMMLLNGLGAIASLQFSAVMLASFLLAYFGALPYILGVIALVYLGCMLAFTVFSWPPEKLILSNSAFAALGFILGAFMLNASTEFSEVSMAIAISYLLTEIVLALYNRYICSNKTENLCLNTSYYRISHDGEYEQGVLRGILKILAINVVLALVQMTANDRIAVLFFSIALNFYLLSILSGDTKPDDFVFLSKWGKKMVKGVFSKKKKTD